jgi:acyl-coenzyme A synthetase/AMP-(fatty) acid ligase
MEPEILAPSTFFIVGKVQDKLAQSWESLFECAVGRVPSRSRRRKIAVLLTTSSTTGEPKFVPHAARTLSAYSEVSQHSGSTGIRSRSTRCAW